MQANLSTIKCYVNASTTPDHHHPTSRGAGLGNCCQLVGAADQLHLHQSLSGGDTYCLLDRGSGYCYCCTSAKQDEPLTSLLPL
jgi:hypothetical protein